MNAEKPSLVFTKRASSVRAAIGMVGRGAFFLVASSSILAVLFIFYFIGRDAIPFFRMRGVTEFFTGRQWYPSANPPSFGALPIFFGSALVTVGAVAVAVPIGVLGAICLSDLLPFGMRQMLKPLVELLAAMPSVAYGVFALVVLAPLLQEQGGKILALTTWLIGTPLALLGAILVSDWLAGRLGRHATQAVRWSSMCIFGGAALYGVHRLATALAGVTVSSGTNALNVSIVLGIMALPTVVSLSEDALQAVGRELREGSYALGATRAETLTRVVLPAASSGICAAVMLGVMRAVGETMVVWMASGNAAQIPKPWFNYLQPIRTLTATIAGDMGEADHVTGSERYHVLFALALSLLAISFALNLASEWTRRAMWRTRRG